MKRVIVAAAALVLLVSSAPAANVIITSDGGGSVFSYASWFRGIAARGDRVVIDGWCASSCTLALAIPTTCATSRSVLGFHASWGSILGFNTGVNVELTRYFMSQYPPKVRAWINARGGLTPPLKLLKGAELAAVVRRCDI
jgi:hypothetical protein